LTPDAQYTYPRCTCWRVRRSAASALDPNRAATRLLAKPPLPPCFFRRKKPAGYRSGSLSFLMLARLQSHGTLRSPFCGPRVGKGSSTLCSMTSTSSTLGSLTDRVRSMSCGLPYRRCRTCSRVESHRRFRCCCFRRVVLAPIVFEQTSRNGLQLARRLERPIMYSKGLRPLLSLRNFNVSMPSLPKGPTCSRSGIWCHLGAPQLTWRICNRPWTATVVSRDVKRCCR